MKKVIIVICFICVAIQGYANDNLSEKLEISHTGSIVNIVDFQEGDTLRLFEFTTADIVLKKTYGEIDFFQLAEGRYVLENTEGKKVLIEYTHGNIEVLFYETSVYTTKIEEKPF